MIIKGVGVMAGSNTDMNAYSSALGVREADSTLSMLGRMAQLMIERGYKPETAYKQSFHTRTVTSYDRSDVVRKRNKPNRETAFDLAVPFLRVGADIDESKLVNLGKAYANLGKTEDAKNIGIMLLSAGDFNGADKVFRYGKINPADVAQGIENAELRNDYISHLVGKLTARREKYLDKRLERVQGDYSVETRKPVVTKVKRFGNKVRKMKEEYIELRDDLQQKEGKYNELEGKRYGLKDFDQMSNDIRDFKRTGKYIENKKSAIANLANDMTRTNAKREENIEKYLTEKRKYFAEKEMMAERSGKKLQKDVEKLMSYMALTTSEKLKPEKSRKQLRKEAEMYLQQGDFKSAHDIYTTLGTLKDKWSLNRMNKYLNRNDGNEEQAAKDYYSAKTRGRKILPAAILTGSLVGAIVGSLIPHKQTVYRQGPPITDIDKGTTLEEKDVFINIEKGSGSMWKAVKEQLLKPGASDQEIAIKTNATSASLGLYDDTVKVVNEKTVKGPDGIYSDVVQPGKYKVDTKLEVVPVESRHTHTKFIHSQERAPWPNYEGAGLGAFAGAGLGVAAALARRRQRREQAQAS
jgi:hypothetical protein